MNIDLYNTIITANASGASPSILLGPNKNWNIFVSSASGMDVNLQASPDNVNWYNVTKDGTIVNFTTNGAEEVNGGLYLRGYLNSYVADVIITAKINK